MNSDMEEKRTQSDEQLTEVSETAGATAGRDTATGTLPEDESSTPDTEAARQRDEYKDLLLRKTAEFENFRKRTERERQSLAEAAAADLLQELLPLVDDLERALQAEATSEAANAYRRGVEIIHRQLSETLRKRGVRPIEALGADFDPHFHQAVSHEPAVGHREGEIVEEFRRGYMLGERLLRPAMVKVAKA